MSRAGLLAGLCLLLTLGLTGGSVDTPLAQVPERPNIVLIVTDDQPESTFKPEIMPRTFEGIVRAGLTFENGAVTTALCCPMRASTLRGQYAHNTSVLKNTPPLGGFETFQRRGHAADNLGVWMKEAGYRTGFFGKVMNGYGRGEGRRYRPADWDTFYGYQGGYVNQNGMVEFNANGRVRTTKRNPIPFFANLAASFVQANGGDAVRPWMAYVATSAPHSPYTVPEAYRRVRGLPTALPTPESFNEADVSDKAPEIRQPPLSGRQIRTEKVAYAKRVKATHAADALVVGRLLDVLEATGQLDETYVFFVADNGMLEGRHRLSTKGMPYEEAHQVPFAVAGPGVRQGISRDLAANIDLAPTFLDIAGAPEREHFDGESLLPAMLGTGGLDRDYLLYEGWWPYGYRAVRTADGFAYIRYNRSGTEEVYDLAADRYQLYGTASEQEAARLPELSAKTDDLFPCAGEECRTTDNGP